MATAHVIAAMDHVLRRASLPGKKRLPFGGRPIAIGDVFQWPPVPPCLFGVVNNNCAAYVLALWGKFRTHELRENFRQKGDPEMQQWLNELHDGVVGGSAWDVLQQRVLGLLGNEYLPYTTPDALVTAREPTPCIAPYKRSNPDMGDTVPQCYEISHDHLVLKY